MVKLSCIGYNKKVVGKSSTNYVKVRN